VFKKSTKGNLIVTKRPDMSKEKWSQAQQEQRQRLAKASAYAKAVLANTDVRARYEEQAASENKRAYYVCSVLPLHEWQGFALQVGEARWVLAE
jgi:hypothetical protein